MSLRDSIRRSLRIQESLGDAGELERLYGAEVQSQSKISRAEEGDRAHSHLLGHGFSIDGSDQDTEDPSTTWHAYTGPAYKVNGRVVKNSHGTALHHSVWIYPHNKGGLKWVHRENFDPDEWARKAHGAFSSAVQSVGGHINQEPETIDKPRAPVHQFDPIEHEGQGADKLLQHLSDRFKKTKVKPERAPDEFESSGFGYKLHSWGEFHGLAAHRTSPPYEIATRYSRPDDHMVGFNLKGGSHQTAPWVHEDPQGVLTRGTGLADLKNHLAKVHK